MQDRRTATTSVVVVVVVVAATGGLLLSGATAQAQSLGHRVPGTLGIHAGDQPGAGVYVVGQLANFASNAVFDRNGDAVPVRGFDLAAVAGAVGVAAIFRLSHNGPYLGVALGVPAGHVSMREGFAQSEIDRGGLGDVYVQPLRLGVKFRQADLSVSYGAYLPTGWYDAHGQHGFGNGQITHEVSAGGTLFFDARHDFFVSALGSVHVNGPKQTIDVTRGATAQVQGGIGVRVFRVVDLGLAAYALWQISDDGGAALPQAQRGARDRVYGAGPEVGIAIAQLNAQLTVRYGHDFGVASRPQGELLYVGLAWRAWDFGASRRRESVGASGAGTGLAF
jgi:hypothetical protein